MGTNTSASAPGSTPGTTGGGTAGSTAGGGAPSSTGGGESGSGTSNTGGSQIPSSPFIYVSGTRQSFSSGNVGGTFSAFIEAFTLNGSSGALTPVSGSPFSTNYSMTSDMAFAPKGAFAYVLAQQFPTGTCCVGPTFLLVYTLDPTSGTPTLKQALATTASEVSTLAVHPSGQFIYVTPYSSNAGTGGIGIFSVNSDGTVAFSGSVAAQSSSSAILDPDGTFLYTSSDGAAVTSLGNNPCGLFYSNLWGFSVNPGTGALTPVGGSPFVFERQLCVVGHAPQYITKQFDPSGQRLYITDTGNATVSVFALDPSSGALTLLPGTSTDGSVGGGFTSSAIDPLGRFLYIGSTTDFFTGFSLPENSDSGMLPLLPGMPVQVTPLPNIDQGSTTMAVDASGSFLFSNENEYTSAFSCCGPDNLVEFRINPATGALVQVSSTPMTLVGTASKIAAAPPP